MGYRVVVRVKEARGRCATGYQPEDTFTVERALLSTTAEIS
jgi:beta-lactamase class D